MTERVTLPKDWIAVLGGASAYTEEQILAAFEVGFAIGKKGKNVITGATTGIPYAAALGAKKAGALVAGISPARSFYEHVTTYKKPVDATDVVIYSGMSFDGRSPLIIRSTAGCVFVGGEFGTLHEFTSAFMNGNNVLGVLTGLGGISDQIQDLIAQNKTNFGSTIIYDNDPVRLISKVCEKVDGVFGHRSERLQYEDIGNDVKDILSRRLTGRSKDV